MKKIFLITCISLGLAIAASAQVKVGSNPTTIATTSNLEVEATNGGKVTITKDSSKVIIRDGSQGNGKVLTSDQNGKATWQEAVSGSWTAVWYHWTAAVNGNPAGGKVVKIGNGGSVTPGTIVIPKTGLYIVSAATRAVYNGSGSFSTTNFQMLINNVDVFWITDNNILPNDGWMYISTRQFRELNAGDVLTFRRQPSTVNEPGQSGVAEGSLEVTLLREN